MLSYDKWKVLNEAIGGSTVLGLGQKQSLGLVSNIPGLQEKTCGSNECGEGEEDMEDEDFEDAQVDLEDYTDGDADEEESEEETEDYEDGVDSEHEEEEDEYEDETEDEDEDYEDEDSDEEEETDYVSDEDEEYNDGEDEDEVEDVEVETDDVDPDAAMKQLMSLKPEGKKHHGKKMRESGKSMKLMAVDYAGKTKMKPDGSKLVPPNNGDKPVKESEAAWWKSLQNQVGQMDASGNIKFEAVGAPDVEEIDVDVEDDPMGHSVEDLAGLTLPSDLKAALKAFMRNIRGKGGVEASAPALANFVKFMLELALEPVAAKKRSGQLGKNNILRLIRKAVMDVLSAHEA